MASYRHTGSNEKQQHHHWLFLHRLVSLVLPGSAVFDREVQGFAWFIAHPSHWQGYFKPRVSWYTVVYNSGKLFVMARVKCNFRFVAPHVQRTWYWVFLCHFPTCLIYFIYWFPSACMFSIMHVKPLNNISYHVVFQYVQYVFPVKKKTKTKSCLIKKRNLFQINLTAWKYITFIITKLILNISFLLQRVEHLVFAGCLCLYFLLCCSDVEVY